MTWRFRKSFSPLPGVRLTLSPSGLSTSIGVGPIRVTAGTLGAGLTARVPGTGLSFQQPIFQNPRVPVSPHPPQAPTFESPETPLSSISSAGSASLTSVGLGELKRLLEDSRREYAAISDELVAVRTREILVVGQYQRWQNGWLLRRCFKRKFQQLGESAEEASAHRAELEEQQNLARLRMQIEVPAPVIDTYSRLCDSFSAMANASRIWDTVGDRRTDRFVERTTADRAVDRRPVSFRLGQCDIIDSEFKVPHLQNANGGDVYLYPAFVLYFVTADSFALLEYGEVYLHSAGCHFHEQEAIPLDTQVVGQTWAKANKDGSRDKRFSDNYQIPILQYWTLRLASQSGMNEEYLVSNAQSAVAFAHAWQSFVTTVSKRD